LGSVGGHVGAEPAEREQEALPRVATGGLAGWDSARRVRPSVDVRGEVVEVWLVQVGLDELPRFAVASERRIEGHGRPHAGCGQADVRDRGHGRIGGA